MTLMWRSIVVCSCPDPCSRHFRIAVHRTSNQAQFCCCFTKSYTSVSQNAVFKFFDAVTPERSPSLTDCCLLWKHVDHINSLECDKVLLLNTANRWRISARELPSLARNFTVARCSCWMSTAIFFVLHKQQWHHKWCHQKYKVSEAHEIYYKVMLILMTTFYYKFIWKYSESWNLLISLAIFFTKRTVMMKQLKDWM